jgi:hypothetical protein
MKRRLYWAAAGLILCAWAAFLITQGLQRADSWSSIAAFAATVVFGVLGLLSGGRERLPELRPQPTQRVVVHGGNAPIQQSGVQHNTFSNDQDRQ